MKNSVCDNSCTKEYVEDVKIMLHYLKTEMELVTANPKHSLESNNHHLLSERGKYLIVLNDLMGRINDLIRDLDHIVVFITRFPNFKTYKDKNINEITYLNYHLEVFVHKIHTILEVMKLYVSNVYELGIPDVDCSYSILLRRKKDIDPYAFDIIDKYYKSFESIINIRHANTHRSIDVNPSSFEVENWLFLKKCNEDLHDPDFFIPMGWIQKKIKNLREEKIAYINNAKDVADTYVQILFQVAIKEIILRAEKK